MYCDKQGYTEATCWDKNPDLKPAKPKQASKVLLADESDQSELIMATKEIKQLSPSLEIAYLARSTSYDNTTWYLDSGASRHICADASLFRQLKPCDITLGWGNAGTIKVTQLGDVSLNFPSTGAKVLLKNCLLVPKLGINLLSLGKLVEKGYSARITAAGSEVLLPKSTKPAIIGIPKGALTLIKATYPPIKGKESKELALIGTSLEVIHQRMGHINEKAVKSLPEHADGVNIDHNSEWKPCDACISANIKRHVSRASPERAKSLLEKVSSDICGPIKPASYGGSRYFITFIDNYSRWATLVLLKTRDELYPAFKNWLTNQETQIGQKLRRFHCDNAKEYLSGNISDLFKEKGAI